jgi:DNA-binding MurR/RpiR family transcriptional regulator
VYREGIRALYGQLSPGYRRIADYLLNHYQDAAFMTAAEIARVVDVDTALVVRFAQRLGYPGFPELINEVQEDVKRDLRAVYEPPEGDSSPMQVFRRNLMQDRNNLDFALLHFDTTNVESAIEALAKARKIFVAGEGALSHLGEALVERLVGLGFNAHPISSELAGQAATSAAITSDDALIALGMTAMTPGAAVVLKVAREQGAKTVAVVGSASNPLAAVAEFVIYAPVNTIGLVPSWSAIASVLHALGQALALSGPDTDTNWGTRTDRFLKIYSETLGKQLLDVRTAVRQLVSSS